MIERKTLVTWLKVGLLVLAAVLSIVAIWVSLYTFGNQLATTNKHMEVNLSRDLIKEFYSGTEKDDLYRRIRMAIERCKHIYKSWGGDFDNDQFGR